jgi:hypothetical protein
VGFVAGWSPFVVLPLLVVLGESLSDSLFWALAVFAGGSWTWLAGALGAAGVRRRRHRG